MRIAIVHSFYTEALPSGENRVVEDQAAVLRAAGHDVALIARRTDDQLRTPGFRARAALTTLSGRGPSPDEDLKRFRPDIVHLHNTFPNWGTAWLPEWCHRLVVTMHNFRPVCSNGLLFRDGRVCHDCLRLPVLPAVRYGCYRGSAVASIPLALASAPRGALRRIPGTAAKVIALNRDAAEMFRETFDRDIDVVPNFVPRAGSVHTERRGWLYVGRFTSEKGIHRLLEVWPSGEPLDLVGDGPLIDQVRLAVAARRELNNLGLLPREEVLTRLSSYEGVILPSLCAEGLPTVVLEGLAAATPSVISDFVVTADQLELAGVAVRYDPEGGPESILAALRTVRTNASSIRAAAIELYEAEYSPTAWLQRIENVYEALLRQVGSQA